MFISINLQKPMNKKSFYNTASVNFIYNINLESWPLVLIPLQSLYKMLEGRLTPEVTWTKDGVPISKITNPELTFSNIGGHVSLTFPNSQLEHSGKYMCSAKNSSGVATSSAQLVVRRMVFFFL